MKRLLILRPLLALLPLLVVTPPSAHAADAPPPQQAPAFKARVLSRAELDELLKKPAEVLIVDVRRPDEVAGIGGFPVYLSVQIGNLSASLPWIPKDRLIVTVSNHAARAGKAADLLAAQGYRVAGAVGAELYEKDGGTLTKLSAPPAGTNGTGGTGASAAEGTNHSP